MNELKKFGPVSFIQGDKGGRYPFCNSLFIEEAGILIDPASNGEVLKKLKDKVNQVWLSHWHEDHIMYLNLFEHCPLLMHKLDEPPISDIDTFIRWYGIDERNEKELVEGWKQLLAGQFNYTPRRAHRHLKEGELIRMDGLTIEVLHVPGHSPGTLAFYFHEPRILFLGDYDLTPFGPWYGDRYSDIDQIIASTLRLKRIPAKIWLTGHEHGYFEENPGDKWDAYLAVIENREEKLLEFLNEPRTLQEIGKAWIVYGKPKEPVVEYEYIEQISMKKHADRLLKRGLIRTEGNRYLRL